MRLFLPALFAFFAILLLSNCAGLSPVERRAAQGDTIEPGMIAIFGPLAQHGSVTPSGNSQGRSPLQGPATGAWSQNLEKQKQELERSISGNGVTVRQTPDNLLTVEVPGDFGFDANRAAVRLELHPLLDVLARALIEYSETTLVIVSHTDGVGSDTLNDRLSNDRAMKAKEYLASKGVATARIKIDGRGRREPLASNETDAGRARNRRVEFIFSETRI